MDISATLGMSLNRAHYLSLRSGLVHYWPFEEASGDRRDIVGGWTLAEGNGALGTIDGKRGLAPNITLANNTYLIKPSVVLPDAITVACWYKFVTPHTIATFLVATNAWLNSTQFALYQLGTGSAVNIVVLVADGAGSTIATENNAKTDGYHLIVGEYDPSTKRVRLIVDGVAGATSDPPLSGTLYRTAAPLNVGYHPNIGMSDTPFDELMVWNRVLTPEEHATLYNGGAGLFHPF